MSYLHMKTLPAKSLPEREAKQQVSYQSCRKQPLFSPVLLMAPPPLVLIAPVKLIMPPRCCCCCWPHPLWTPRLLITPCCVLMSAHKNTHVLAIYNEMLVSLSLTLSLTSPCVKSFDQSSSASSSSHLPPQSHHASSSQGMAEPRLHAHFAQLIIYVLQRGRVTKTI